MSALKLHTNWYSETKKLPEQKATGEKCLERD
jgi:hypothetical protein